METMVSNLARSRYYSTSFNAAICDGVIRIYFAQHQESEALKIYFKIQEALKKRGSPLKSEEAHIFIMLYPDSQSFSVSFSHLGSKVDVDEFDGGFVIGLNGPVFDDDPMVYNDICCKVLNVLDRICLKSLSPEAISEANL